LYTDQAKKVWSDPRDVARAQKNTNSLGLHGERVRYLCRGETPAWVAVPVSPFERFPPTDAPSKIPTVEKALKDFGAVVRAHQARGRRVLVLCGIDLAHVGPRFGAD